MVIAIGKYSLSSRISSMIYFYCGIVVVASRMYNYYNILPIILIHVFIIIIFEGALFFLYLLKKQEDIVNDQINNYTDKLITVITNELPANGLSNNSIPNYHIGNIKSLLKPNIDTDADTRDPRLIIKNYLNLIMNTEEEYLDTNRTTGIYIFIAILSSIVILLLIYTFLVYYIWKKTIDWHDVFIIVGAVIVLIVIMELQYVFNILFNKKFNYSHIKLAFLDALIK